MCTMEVHYFVDGDELPEQIYYASNWELVDDGQLSGDSRA